MASRDRAHAARAFFLGLCAWVCLSACDFAQDKDDAAAYAEHYFAAAARGDTSAVLPLYSPRFFAATPRETWSQTLKQVRDQCGTPSTHKLESWQTSRNFGTNAGTTVKLTYDVKYQHCRVTETLVVFRPPEGSFSILGHNFHMNESAPAAPAGTATT